SNCNEPETQRPQILIRYGLAVNHIVPTEALNACIFVRLLCGTVFANLGAVEMALSAARVKGKVLMKGKYWKRMAVSVAMSAALLATSSLANAQGRRGRGEERSQQDQAERDQRQQQRAQERQQQQQQSNQDRQQRWEQRQQQQQQANQ